MVQSLLEYRAVFESLAYKVRRYKEKSWIWFIKRWGKGKCIWYMIAVQEFPITRREEGACTLSCYEWWLKGCFHIISPLPACRGGTISLLAVCLSVRLSVCQSVTLQFSRFFSVVFWDIDLKFGIWTCHDIIQIKSEFRQTWLTFMGVIALC